MKEILKQTVKNIWVLAKKEIRLLAYSPIVYVVGVFFLALIGWYFITSFLLSNVMTMQNFFEFLPIVFSFIIPAFTMRSLSEEYSTGSFELLMSFPLTKLQIVMGKFLANFIFSLFLILPTFLYPIALSGLGDFYWPSIITSYMGSILLCAFFISIGIFSSSLTKNQIVAWILGVAICLFLTMVSSIIYFLPTIILDFFRYISVAEHFEAFSLGVVDFRDLLYFISGITLFSYMTYVAIDWRVK